LFTVLCTFSHVSLILCEHMPSSVDTTIKKPTLVDLQQLLEFDGNYAVSMYIPTDEVGLQAMKRKAQLQNAERAMMQQLEKLNAPEEVSEKLQENLRILYMQDELWEVQQKSLALFVAPGFSDYFQLPIEVKPIVHVNSRFHLKSLIKLITNPLDFYLLSISQESATMYVGDRYELRKIDVPNMPETVENVVGTENQGNPRPAAQHGNSSQDIEDKHRYTKRFLQAVDKTVVDFLEQKKKPLLLTGTERVVTIYQGITKYSRLVQSTLRDNDKSFSMSKVHKEAVAMMEEYYITEKKKEVEELLKTGDSALFSDKVEEILREAELGRVDTVLVAHGERDWGEFDPQTLSTHFGNNSLSHDLLDTVCAVTLLRGGKAYVLPPEQMPQHKTAIAVFRY
jgi:hypothetical protein